MERVDLVGRTIAAVGRAWLPWRCWEPMAGNVRCWEPAAGNVRCCCWEPAAGDVHCELTCRRVPGGAGGARLPGGAGNERPTTCASAAWAGERLEVLGVCGCAAPGGAGNRWPATCAAAGTGRRGWALAIWEEDALDRRERCCRDLFLIHLNRLGAVWSITTCLGVVGILLRDL
jgi:hypothetical protein